MVSRFDLPYAFRCSRHIWRRPSYLTGEAYDLLDAVNHIQSIAPLDGFAVKDGFVTLP